MRRFLVPQVYAEPGATVPAVCFPKSADSILTLSFPAAILAAKKREYNGLLLHTSSRAHPTTPPEARLSARARVKEAHPTRCTGSTARRVLFCPCGPSNRL